MQNLLDGLKNILEQDERLVVDGKLLKNKIIESALKLDADLIKLLLKSEYIKKHFFQEVDGIFVFDKIKFQKFVSNKAFLSDSYTSFKNKMGLVTENEEYLSESKEVVLAWPYKDCVLEGGMEKEDEKRDEIFYNEILAPDEIDRLLEPKVLTNFKKIDKNGEHKIKEIKKNDNLIIRGNNLLALHSLKKRFAGKVKLIYIDPPYNRDAESFYNDSFHHSSWLVFMKNRLEVSRYLLSPDGFIFIQIDDAQQAYLKVLCDEVFKNNFVNCIAVKSSETSGVKMAHVEKRLPKLKDYILVYRKSEKALLRPIQIEKDFMGKDKDYLKYYSKIIEDLEAQVEDWKIVSITDYCAKKNIEIKSDEDLLNFKLENAERVIYRTNNKSFAGLKFKTPTAEVISASGIKYIWWEGKQMLFLKDYLVEHLADFWSDISTINLNKEGGVDLPAGKKPEELLHRIIKLTTEKNDIILDFFLGSGTTTAVTHKMVRQYIGIEQLDYGENDSVVRLKNVINGDQSGISKSVNWQGGGDFVYAELARWNEEAKEKILKAKSLTELEKLFDELYKRYFLNYNVKTKEFKEKILKEEGFKKLSLDEQKNLFVEMLDMNQMYVNFSERADKKYNLSEIDIKLSEEFYLAK